MDTPIGLNLPTWKPWVGGFLLLLTVVIGVVAIFFTVDVIERWPVDDPVGEVFGLVIRWALVAILGTIGLVIFTANDRARIRAAKETLRHVR